MRNKIFEYNEFLPNGKDTIVRVSGEDILTLYYPFWEEQMDKKYGIGRDRSNDIKDCIEDFVIINWAWEVTNETN